ncbi:MAG: leucyl aminopeptidase [Synechococcaceae cyanobacterium RL_1_2]|nr:leucyl aminopeptidase [Synechococcaceae cyanobacterium RL_1_2]
MEIKGIGIIGADWEGETLALGLWHQDNDHVPEALTSLDQKLNGAIAELITDLAFRGDGNTSGFTRLGGNSPIRKLMLVGLGPQAAATPNTLRQAAGLVGRSCLMERVKQLGLWFPGLETPQHTAAIAEGLLLAVHQDDRFKSEANPQASLLENVDIIGVEGQAKAIAQAQALTKGVILARELVNAPANSVDPMAMGTMATTLAQEYGFGLEILNQADCEALGMGAYLGVAAATDIPPQFIHLTYRPQGAIKKKLAIVGKGLTFDSGGLNIKTSMASIGLMKTDMGGAGATFGAAKAIGELKPEGVEVHFISAVTENMISGKAMRPGDILTASNGLTIEINNTDAEGRLTLADALVFAEKLKVDAIVDLATLTGACVVALGEDIAGLWSNNDDLAQSLKTASTNAGEKFWQMPLESNYAEGLKSTIADLKNTGPRGGGAITAALFLQKFVQQTPWAHLDVAGTVWTEKGTNLAAPGATGFGVTTLVHWVLDQA